MLASQVGRASGGGGGRALPGAAALAAASPPPSPDDLETGSSKYGRPRRRQRSGGLAWRPRTAAAAAAGVAAAFLLTALVGRIAAGLTHAPVLPDARDAGGSCCLSDEQIRSTLQSLAAARRPWAAATAEEPAGQAAHDVLAAGSTVAVPGVQPRRMSDEPYGRQSSANIPGVEDVHAELSAYSAALLDSMVADEAAAAARQRRPAAADLGLLPLDALNETASLPHRIAFLNELHAEVQAGESVRVAVTATVAADAWGVRRDLLPWMQYHVELGAARFYLLYDGSDAEAVRLLGALRCVSLLHIHAPWAPPADAARFQLYQRGAADVSSRQWGGGQPGNFQLMVKQGYGESEALRLAAADRMDWLLHLDPDELLHPGGPAPSLTAVLGRQPPHVPAVRFMNLEAQPEAADLTNRFEQVTLFRVHKHFISPEAGYWRQKFKLGDNAAFLALYANGKSAVRVDAPGVRQMGPHFFGGDASPRWQTPSNPAGEWRDVVSDDSVILHYAYALEGDVAAKAARSCPEAYLEAARRGHRDKVKECFVIDLDVDAYMAAAQGAAAARDFYVGRMVLSEGARVRCADPATGREAWCSLTDVPRLTHLLEKLGLYRRFQAPQALLRQHERRIRQRVQSSATGGSGQHEPMH